MHSLFRAAAATVAVLLTAPLAASAASLPGVPPADAQYDSGSLHVAKFGRGDPVVLIPGLTTGPWEWGDVLRRLAANHTVYAVWLPGFDGRPAATPPLFDRVTRDFWAFLTAQKIARPAVVGHSLGGILAIALGEQHPERLRAIVSIDGLPIFPGNERLTAEQRAAAAQQAAATFTGQSREQLLATMKGFMRTPYGGVLDPEIADRAAELESTSDPLAISQWIREVVGGDLRPDLPKITVPLLEIAGYNAPDLVNAPLQYTEDQKAAYYRGLLSGAPKVQVVTVSPARHFVQLDQPDRVLAIVEAFLSQNR